MICKNNLPLNTMSALNIFLESHGIGKENKLYATGYGPYELLNAMNESQWETDRIDVSNNLYSCCIDENTTRKKSVTACMFMCVLCFNDFFLNVFFVLYSIHLKTLLDKQKYRVWDKTENNLKIKFGGMNDLSDPKNEINATDLSHIQTANILYEHLSDIKKTLNLKTKFHVGYCSDAATNVSSTQAGVAGKV